MRQARYYTPSYANLDRTLSRLGDQLRIVHFLNPTNLRREKVRFFASLKRGQPYNPQFHYPPIPLRVEKVRETLRRMRVPTNNGVGRIFEMKRVRLLERVSFLAARGSLRSLPFGYLLYGAPSHKLFRYAAGQLEILKKTKEHAAPILSSPIAARILGQALKRYGLAHWRVQEKKNLAARAGISGKRNTLFIREGSEFSRSDINRLIVHEIETHIFRVENGRLQPFSLFAHGFPGPETTEEGLAIWNELRINPPGVERQRIIFARTLAVACARKGSFLEVFKRLVSYRLRPDSAWEICVRVKRGLKNTGTHGAFTKDYHYLKGYLEVENYQKKGGDLTKLYVGKINVAHVALLPHFPSLVPPRYLPPRLDLF